MLYNTQNGQVNMTLGDMIFIARRKREPFLRFDSAQKTDSSFVMKTLKRDFEEEGKEYFLDTNLSSSIKLDDTLIAISGKINVIKEGEKLTLDLVKTLKYPLELADEEFLSTWIGELYLSAYLFLKSRELECVFAKLTVFHADTLLKKEFSFTLEKEELEHYFFETVKKLAPFVKVLLKNKEERTLSADKLAFPFDTMREGQEEISREVYTAIKNRNNVIINAPTGLGKTLATLYPALLSQRDGLLEKVFYLTAKNSGNTVAFDALLLFLEKGYDLTTLVLSAKNKICHKEKCSPQTCSFPCGHSERVCEALFYLVTNEKLFTYDTITETAKKYNVCPFILETELALFSNVIICDYNYVFDPDVAYKLKVAFSGKDAFLVDEAHNLIDRLRHIYKAEIDLEKLLSLKDKLKASSPLFKKALDLVSFVREDIEEQDTMVEPLSSYSLEKIEMKVSELYCAFQDNALSKSLTYFEIREWSDTLKKFMHLLSLKKGEYQAFYNDKGYPEVFLSDTSKIFLELTKRLGSFILFSATLFPEEYYRYMLGSRDDDMYVSFPSPFEKSNFLVLAYPVSTKFADREATVKDVVTSIYLAGSSKVGNYISFFPSYQYMNLALTTFKRLYPDEKVIYQKPSMTEREKREYLSEFVDHPEKTLFAFAVLGGSFSEGVDLVGEKLSGAVVVGLGSLPPSRKLTLVSSYFNDLFFDGNLFAYHYPGLNKVFQAGGRVIRSESDKGFLLIIDDRFLTEENLELLPDNWTNIKKVREKNSISTYLSDFWNT